MGFELVICWPLTGANLALHNALETEVFIEIFGEQILQQ